MADQFTILIADRNPHVREFLRRELVSEDYHVQVAKDGREVLSYTRSGHNWRFQHQDRQG